jgi:hypothetical protein
VGVDSRAAGLRYLEDRATLRELAGFADVVQWNPLREGLSEAIVKQVM